MAFFRKLGASLAPAFRKMPSEIGRFGRKLSSGAGFVERNLEKLDGTLGKIDKAVPNPIIKTIRGGVGAMADVAGGVSQGGRAVDALSRGDYRTAQTLGKAGWDEARSGVSKGLSVAPFLLI